MSGCPNKATILLNARAESIHLRTKFKSRDSWSASTLLDPGIWAADNQMFLTMAQFQISWVRELQTWLNDLPIFYKTILDNFKAPIPKHLLSIAKESDTFNKNFFTSNDNTFQLNDSVQINFEKARSRDFYKLFTSKTHTQDQTGPKR